MAGLDRIYIKYANRELLEKWKEEKVIGFDSIESKEIFLFLAAIGLESPKEIQGKKDGYLRREYLREADKAFFSSKLLAKRSENEEIDQYCNFDDAILDMEKCAESGFDIFKEKVEKADGNKELLYKRLLSELDMLYEKNVKEN